MLQMHLSFNPKGSSCAVACRSSMYRPITLFNSISKLHDIRRVCKWWVYVITASMYWILLNLSVDLQLLFQTVGWDTLETSHNSSTALYPVHPTLPSWMQELKPSPINTCTSLWLLLISFQIRSERRAPRRGVIRQLNREARSARRCSHLSPATSCDNIRQGLNQQTGLTLGDQAGYLQLCGERSI